MNYRQLTEQEIQVLENNVCWAEDWSRVLVDKDFRPYNFHRVMFYGDIRLGSFEKSVEVSKGFVKHSGINDATLRNVSVGNDCLIEKVSGFINNYTIGDNCYIANVSTIETTEGANYGAGSLISVLNEMGVGNITLFRELNSQLAAFMVKYSRDKVLTRRLHQLIDGSIHIGHHAGVQHGQLFGHHSGDRAGFRAETIIVEGIAQAQGNSSGIFKGLQILVILSSGSVPFARDSSI